jgi:hypothetical protein
MLIRGQLIPYQSAFTALIIGALFFLCALLAVAQGPRLSPPLIYAVVAVLGIVQSIRMRIYYTHKYDDDPIGAVFPAFRRKSRKR